MGNKKISLVCFVTLSMTFAGVARAAESYFENFDSFQVGSNIIGQGDWTGWADDPNPDYGAPLTDQFALSGNKSLEIGGGNPGDWTDIVWQFPEVISGQYTFSAMTYIPSTSTSATNPAINFMISHPGPLVWGGEMRFFLDRGQVDYAGNAGNPVPMVRDAWVKVQLDVDLLAQQASMFYNDEPLGDFAWNGVDFVAVNLWAPAGTSPIYYDNLSLVPPVTSDLTGNGFVDFEDLTVLLANWNKDVTAAEGNLVEPLVTVVNFDDLTVLLADWTGPGPAGSPEAALGEAVPEPSTLLLALLATLGLSFYRRRGRRAF